MLSEAFRKCFLPAAVASAAALLAAGHAVSAERAAAPPAYVVAQDADDADAMAKKMLDEAKDAIDEALSEAKGKAKAKTEDKSDGKKAAPTHALAAMEGSTAPIPVPAGAEELEFDGADGRLEFKIKSSVKDVSEFYRSALKPQGWSEQRSVINKETMSVLNFEKGDKDLSLTIMKMGDATSVMGNGSALAAQEREAGASGAPGTAPSESGADATKPSPTADQLEAEETGGWPVPKEHSSAGHESTPFRVAVTASVPASVEAVAGFYRRELQKRDFKEQTERTTIEAKRAELFFTSPDGPAKLALGRKNGETDVVLTLRKTSAAEKSGFLPEKGQARLLFGNILDVEAAVVIDKKTVKVPAHTGEKSPDGPSLQLKPGRYAYSLKAKGVPASGDSLEIGADEIWAVMVGPGGVLALQMY